LIDVNKPPEEDIEEIKELEKKKTMKKKVTRTLID